MQGQKIEVVCSKCRNIEKIEINDSVYESHYPELQHVGDKKCSKCGKMLVVYIHTYIDNVYEYR